MNFCAEAGCNGIAKAGKFCDAHKADNYEKRRNAARPKLDRWYSLAAWCGPYGVRGFKLRRFPICETPDCNAVAVEVHHKDSSWKETGDWNLFVGGVDMENLVSLCHACHSRITIKENRKRGAL